MAPSAEATVIVRFSVIFVTRVGQNLRLVGDHPALGSWQHRGKVSGRMNPDPQTAKSTDSLSPLSFYDLPSKSWKSSDTQTNTESLVFHFASSEEGVSHQCLFGLLADLSENTPWKTCRSPSIYMDQPEGLYRFRVRAQDQAGNVGSFVEGKLALISPHPSLSAHPYPFH